MGGVYELTLKLTSASTRVGVEVGLSLAKKSYGLIGIFVWKMEENIYPKFI